jgi:hypothetical protein
LDITTNEFRRVGSLILSREPVDIVIQANMAYLLVAGSDSALIMADISDPVAPKLVKTMALTSKWPIRGAVAANLVCAASGDTIKVVDVQNPSRPVLKSATKMPALDLACKNKLAYVGCQDGMRIVNMGDPAKPAQLSFLPTAGVQAICLDKEYAYLLGCRNAEPRLNLTIVNIADSTKPKQVGEASATVGKGLSTSTPARIAVANGLAYLAVSNRLFIFDVSQPSAPAKKGQLEITEGDYPAFQSLNVVPPFIYAAMGSSDHGFIKIDISNSASPSLAATLIEPWDVTHFFIRNTLVFASSSERLLVYDYKNPNHPVLVGADKTWQELVRIYVEGNMLYAVDQSRLYVIDVADPARMQKKGEYAIPAGKKPRALSVHATTIWLLTVNQDNARSQLVILDAANPAQIQAKGTCEFAGEGRDLFVPDLGGFAYIAFAGAAGRGLQIVNVANPALPALAGSAQTHGIPTCIWVTDSLAYIGNNQTGNTWYIEAFNVANPKAPLQVGETSNKGQIVDLEVAANHLFASIRGGCVYDFKLTLTAYAVLFKFINECHSPASIYIGLMWLAHNMFVFTCDGAWSIDALLASASLGIYIQNVFFALLPVEQSDSPPIPMQIELQQNYPNPFNPSTTIRYSLAAPQKVKLEIYNSIGQCIAVLVDERQSSGAHEIIFNAKGWASGLYFYRLQAGHQLQQRKMVLLE